MFCKNCGKILISNAKFCKYCGTEFNISAEQKYDSSSHDASENTSRETQEQEVSNNVSPSQVGKGISSLKLVGLVTGLVLVASAVIYTVTKKSNLGKEFERPKSAEEILNKNYEVHLKDYEGKTYIKNLKITAELDKKTNTLYFENYTQDYNRQNWQGTEEEYLTIPDRHTEINPFSKTFILHPKQIKISEIEQQAYLVPQYKWDQDLKPYEKHKEAQLMVEGGEKILDWATRKIPIPFFKEFYEKFIENSYKKNQEYYRNLFEEKIIQGYTATIIPSFIKRKLIGSTITAREYKIHFDLSNLEKNKEVKIYLYTMIVLGDASIDIPGSFPHKYGELENVFIEFGLEGNKKEANEIVTKSKKSKKQFTLCVYGDPGRNRDGSSPLKEVIFYIRLENSDWEEFCTSHNECASSRITLENSDSFVDVKAVGQFDNGRGNEWTIYYASQGRRITWNTKEGRIELYSNR